MRGVRSAHPLRQSQKGLQSEGREVRGEEERSEKRESEVMGRENLVSGGESYPHWTTCFLIHKHLKLSSLRHLHPSRVPFPRLSIILLSKFFLKNLQFIY